jgi:hypothetical protein
MELLASPTLVIPHSPPWTSYTPRLAQGRLAQLGVFSPIRRAFKTPEGLRVWRETEAWNFQDGTPSRDMLFAEGVQIFDETEEHQLVIARKQSAMSY